MADYPRNTSEDSLWAVSREGVLWQINTRNCQAAPVAPASQLPAQDLKTLQQEMIHLWQAVTQPPATKEPVTQYLKNPQAVSPKTTY